MVEFRHSYKQQQVRGQHQLIKWPAEVSGRLCAGLTPSLIISTLHADCHPGSTIRISQVPGPFRAGSVSDITPGTLDDTQALTSQLTDTRSFVF